MGEGASSPSWAYEACLESGKTSPEDLLEDLMADSRCAAFGVVHHFLVGASLLTCLRNAQGRAEEGRLEADLAELGLRSAAVPGAACAKWGVCGAAASAGMAYAIAAGNEPLKAAGWSEGQLMVADIGRAVALAGAPRCCKRDARIAVETAAKAFARDFEVDFSAPVSARRCRVAERNAVCLEGACPFHGAGAEMEGEGR